MAGDHQRELLASVLSHIKSYNGRDPLRPWVHGIRRMKEALPPQILKEKLPRFLQKCAQTFESDRRYRNDSRYLRVWIELMDYVDDARPVLRKMEKNQVGLKRAMFYLAYALYYEKHKKFDEAEEMYRTGVQNLAEPVGDLQKSYEQFLRRREQYKKRKAEMPLQLQEVMFNKGCSTSKSIHQGGSRSNITESQGSTYRADRVMEKSVTTSDAGLVCRPHQCKDEFIGSSIGSNLHAHKENAGRDLDKLTPFSRDDTVVVKFVDSAIVGKSEAEDACHHGLVDPTINMKDAMDAISSMFREPIEPQTMLKRRTHQNKPKANQRSSGFEVFVDESYEEGPNLCHQHSNNDLNGANNLPSAQSHKHHDAFRRKSSKKQPEMGLRRPVVGDFKILADDEEDEEHRDKHNEGIAMHFKGSEQPSQRLNVLVSSKQNDQNVDDFRTISSGLREDTVIRRFVGSTVFGEPEVENACHHGLVDPTINLKEAMDDINSMFGKPINFKGEKPKKKQGSLLDGQKPGSQGFSILADDELEGDLKGQASWSVSCKLGRESDLFEPTLFTKEAMADINEMFGKPLDF